ncbi:MAG TPA: metallophosphoesterase [Thermoanaerobaculia bacterium]|nr:metallophosphoesterase [Thermoanaerobaculia bacterium]
MRRFIVVVAVWMSLWWAIIGALLAPVLPGYGLPVLLAALVTAAPILVFGRMRTRGIYPSAAIRLWVFRPFWYAQLSLPLIASGGVLGLLAGAPFGVAASTGRWALLVAASGFFLAAIAGYIGSRWLRVEELDAHFPDLPAGLEGMRIVQVSDLHVGPHTSRSYLAKVAQAVQAARPDLLAITGDQVDDYGRDVAYFAEAFSGLSAPHGVFAIPGNHDVYAGWPAVRAGLEAMGITVLVNDAVEVVRGEGRFWLAGTGDPAGRRGTEAAPDLNRTLAPVPEGAFTIALAHNPALWPGLAKRGVPLTLSGHTHHGQLSIPNLGWSLASPFLQHAMGSHRLGESLLYINPGTNYWGLPFRIGALPEVTVLTLRRSPGREAGFERS